MIRNMQGAANRARALGYIIGMGVVIIILLARLVR